MNDFFLTCATLLENKEDVVMVTITDHGGSSPRKAGSKMLVRRNGAIAGTIGGGIFEAQAIQIAREVFQSGQATIKGFRFSGKDVAGTDMICGGRAEIFVDLLRSCCPKNAQVCRAISGLTRHDQGACLVTRLAGGLEQEEGTNMALLTRDKKSVGMTLAEEVMEAAFGLSHGRFPRQIKMDTGTFLCEPMHNSGTVYIFGAGHVSQKLAHLCTFVDFQTVIIDDREQFANSERFPEARQIIVADTMDNCMETLPVSSDSYLVIVTRGHVYDAAVLAQALRTDAGYIGMIGSKRKRDTIYQHLLRQGISEEDLARVHSPIGIAIASETPEEIAVSIIAELIDVRAGLLDA